METKDATIHPIQRVGNVPFGEEGNQTYIKNVLHVPIIMKNLVLVGQIVEQDMQVCFNDEGCFIEKEGRLIARGQSPKGSAKRISPHQSPKAQRNAVERSRHRTPDFYQDGDYRRVRRLPIRQTTPNTVPKGEEREQRDPGCNTFRCMGTNPNAIIRWLSLLCDLYQRLLKAHMDILCGRRVKCSSSLFYWSDESDYSIFL